MSSSHRAVNSPDPHRSMSPGATTPPRNVMSTLQSDRSLRLDARHRERNECSVTPNKQTCGVEMMLTPSASSKRHAEDSGPRTRGTSGRTRSGRKRRRRRTTLRGLPDLSAKIAEEEWRSQQEVARKQARDRKEREIAEHQQGMSPAGGDQPIEFRRKVDGGKLRRPAMATLSRTDNRRQSAPGRLLSTGDTKMKSNSRPKACSRSICGWVTPTPGLECESCSEKVVHSADAKLCSACHRTSGHQDFVHLRAKRIERWLLSQDVGDGTAEHQALPKSVIKGFRPSSDCLCQRDDCFYVFLNTWERRSASRRCVDCGASSTGRHKKRWFYLHPETIPSSMADAEKSALCEACNSRRRKRDEKSAACSTKFPSNAPEANPDVRPRRHSLDNVRKKVILAVGRGEILFWEDVAGWLTAELSKAGLAPYQERYKRDVVRKMFNDIAEQPHSTSRVVCGDGGGLGHGDARRKLLFLFPNTLSDDIIANYVMRARVSDATTRPTGDTSKEEREITLQSLLEEVVGKRDAEKERMAVVRAAGKIVRFDVENERSLKNVPGRGKANRYECELKMAVRPVLESLLSLPTSLLALFQSMTRIPLYRDVAGESLDPGPGWVWDERWGNGLQQNGAGPTEHGNRASGRREPASPTTSVRRGMASSTVGSERNAAHTDKMTRDRRSFPRRLYLMCTGVVKAILRGQHMASHEVKAAQWAKSKGTCRSVMDFVAEQGLWASAAKVRHREDEHVKETLDTDLLRKDACCAAIPYDNCDFDLRVGERQGEGPHVSMIAATSVTVGPEVGRLDRHLSRSRRSLSVEDVMTGPNAAEGERRFVEFGSKLRGAVTASALSRWNGSDTSTCFESELRQGLSPDSRAETDKRYLFIHRASTKSYRQQRATIDRIIRIWRGTEAGKDGAPFLLAGDEETYRFMARLMSQESARYDQVRRYPGDWHVMLHLGKALLQLYWGAGVEFVAKALGTDDKKSGEGGNHRRAHHHLTVMFEALWTLCMEGCLKDMGAAPGDARAGEDLGDLTVKVVRWIEMRAEEHKTFALWKQFLLHDYPAYMTFRVALRTGNFMLRLDALRRVAPIFYITGKDRYQFLVADHLAEMARMSESDLRVVSELFSVSLGPDACARLGLDERQEVANGVYKGLTKRVLTTALGKLAPIAQLRELAQFEFEREFIDQPRTLRDRCRELVVKRNPSVRTAVGCLRTSPAFSEDEGKAYLTALDGRVFTDRDGNEILGAPVKAQGKMEECVAFYVLNDLNKKRATKTKIPSIPPKNKATKPAKAKGRLSALKDSIGNAYAGGQEFKALVLNTLGVVEEGGVVTAEQMMDMVTSLGAATPFHMANATGGAKHANKSAGPLKWINDNDPHGFSEQIPFPDPDAHGVDLPVSIHQGVGAEGLEGGAQGIIEQFTKDVLTRWWQPATQLLLINYDDPSNVPVIKVREQQGRTGKLGVCNLSFDPSSTSPIPSSQYQSFLRSNNKRARDGIAASVAKQVLTHKVWEGDKAPKGIIAFYGVSGQHGPGDAEAPGVEDQSACNGEVAGETPPGELSMRGPLVHYRDGSGADARMKRLPGPNVGEAELSLVHFMVWSKKYFGKDFKKWIISSIDTDQWMIILLAMSTGNIAPTGPLRVDVAVRKVVGSAPKYLWVNSVFETICNLEDGSESAWPTPGFHGWVPERDDKVRLFVLVYLLAGCDFLPAISGLGFGKMWEGAMKSVRAEGLFQESLFRQEGEQFVVDIASCTKLLATMFFYKHEACFARAGRTPGKLLREVRFNVREYVNVIRVIALKLTKNRAVSIPPSYEAMVLQCERGNSVFGYWQDGTREKMPQRSYDGTGWGIDPAAKGSAAETLTKDNCVMWLSEYSYIDTAGKTVTLACGCSPQTASRRKCKSCSCRNRKCSLACGCRKLCQTGNESTPLDRVSLPAPSVVANTRPVASSVVANAIALFTAQNNRANEDDPHLESDESSGEDVGVYSLSESESSGMIGADTGASSDYFSDGGSDCDNL